MHVALRIPDTLDEALSSGWLTAALSRRFPGIHVTAVQPGPVVSRVSTNARFRIDCDGGLPPGLSPHLCIKGYFANLAAGRAGVPEALFYRDLADVTGIRTLHCVYADVDPVTEHAVVITEDVVAEGATFLDGTSEYSPDQAADSLAELAKLHAAMWGNPTYEAAPWLAPHLARTLEARGEPDIRGNFEGPEGADVPVEVRDAARLVASYRAVAAEVERAQPWTVVHGDPHPGNMFLDASGHPAFVDWQLVQRAPWYVDVGYHIAAVLSVEDRRCHEQDLLRHYLDCLVAAGVTAPSWNVAWPVLKRGIVCGFFLWGITLLVDPAITSSLLHRLGTAAADHNALAGLGAA